MKKSAVLWETGNPFAEKFDVLNGMCCKFRSKAAFMAMIAHYETEGENLLVKVIMDHEVLRRKFIDTDVAGLKTLLLNVDDLEKMYDAIVVKSKGSYDNLNLMTRLYAKPLELNNEILEIDSMGYLLYGMIKNPNCLRELKQYVSGREEELYHEFRESSYFGTEILSIFMQKDKKLAALLIGLICIARKELAEAEDTQNIKMQVGDRSVYGDLLKIVFAGYKKHRNRIKRLTVFNIDDFKDVLTENINLFDGMSEATICLLFAEYYGIPVESNYMFYNFIYCLWRYRTYFVKEESGDAASTERGRKWRNKYFGTSGLSSFYNVYYNQKQAEDADDQEKREAENGYGDFFNENARTLEESIFEQFHLNLRAFAGYELDNSEVDGLCELLAQNKEKEYDRHLLLATMCKYVHELEMLCMEQSKEEKEYQEINREKMIAENLSRDFEKEKEGLIQAKKQAYEKLADSEREKAKLKECLKNMEEEGKTEKQELAALRNYVYQQEQGAFDDGLAHNLDKEVQLKQSRLVIVGGHPSWQKKMKEYFSNAVLIGADSLNFASSMLHGIDYIIMNTSIMKHACYYRVLAQKDARTKILYAGSNNRDLCLRQLCMQLN